MEQDSYTILKHVIGENHSKYTAAEYIEVKLRGDADLDEVMQEFKRFLLAVGYHKECLDQYIEDN